MKIVWYSNPPWVKGGYGVQTRLFVPRLRSLGYEVVCMADTILYHGIVKHTDADGSTYDVFPAQLNRYGDPHLHFAFNNLKGDVMIHHGCVWGVNDSLMALPWVPWFPVDRDPAAPAIMAKAQNSRYPICFSRQGQQSFLDNNLPCEHIPLAVDTKVYEIRDKMEARDYLGLDKDRYVVAMVCDNKGHPSRKAIFQQIEGFLRFQEHHPEAQLVCHTNTTAERAGINLSPYLQHHKITDEQIKFPDQRAYGVGFVDDYMVNLYNAADVLLNVSMDEGFGVPIVEAQACGTPVITGDWTAMPENTETGWLVLKNEAEPWWNPHLFGYQYLPHIQAITARLIDAHEKKDDMRTPIVRQATRDKVLRFDVDRVLQDGWAPILKQIENCFVTGSGRLGLAKPEPETALVET